MAGKLDFDPGQAAMGHQLTISEILAEYLRMERGRLAPKTHARYTEVIVLFTQSLNGYAANSLSQFDRARFDKLFNAEGEQHREFCDMFGPEHILENVGEFLNYFMVGKVMAGADTLRASGTVMKKLAKWLAERDYVGTDDAALTIAQGADAAQSTGRRKALGASLRPHKRSPCAKRFGHRRTIFNHQSRAWPNLAAG